MADFQFLQNPISKKWIILAPRRAKRPDISKGSEPVCPFCVGREKDEQELYRVPAPSVISSEMRDPSNQESVQQARNDTGDWPANNASQPARIDSRSVSGESDAGWLVRVLPNKFPFAPVHEIIIHSPDHHKNFDQLSLHQIELLLQTYRQRYMAHYETGQVYIFHNRGEGGGESLPHPHTQLAVVPIEVKMDIPRLDPTASFGLGPKAQGINSHADGLEDQEKVDTPHFYLFCPRTSQWPDEVWVAPKKRGRAFGEITNPEIADLAYTLNRLIRILDIRHGNEFPFNFYIYPGGDWYLRIIPRVKSMGGFELGTGIFINTQDPLETITFIKNHFEKPDEEKIKQEHRAEYEKHV